MRGKCTSGVVTGGSRKALTVFMGGRRTGRIFKASGIGGVNDVPSIAIRCPSGDGLVSLVRGTRRSGAFANRLDFGQDGSFVDGVF